VNRAWRDIARPGYKLSTGAIGQATGSDHRGIRYPCQSRAEASRCPVPLVARWGFRGTSDLNKRVRDRSWGRGGSTAAIRAGRDGPLSGVRGGDRFARALISLALDEVDATEVLPWHQRFEEHCRVGVQLAQAVVSRESNLGQPGLALRRQHDRATRGRGRMKAIVRTAAAGRSRLGNAQVASPTLAAQSAPLLARETRRSHATPVRTKAAVVERSAGRLELVRRRFVRFAVLRR
jgi:hypothetical protein